MNTNFIYTQAREIDAPNIALCHPAPKWLWTAELHFRQSQDNLEKINLKVRSGSPHLNAPDHPKKRRSNFHLEAL